MQAAAISAVGLEMGVAVAMGLWGGLKLDEWLGTRPVFILIGLFVGFGAAAKAIVDVAKRANRALDDESRTDDVTREVHWWGRSALECLVSYFRGPLGFLGH